MSLNLKTSRILRPRAQLTAWQEGWTSPSTALGQTTIFSPGGKATAVTGRPGDRHWRRQVKRGAQTNDVQGKIHSHKQEEYNYCPILEFFNRKDYTVRYNSVNRYISTTVFGNVRIPINIKEQSDIGGKCACFRASIYNWQEGAVRKRCKPRLSCYTSPKDVKLKVRESDVFNRRQTNYFTHASSPRRHFNYNEHFGNICKRL